MSKEQTGGSKFDALLDDINANGEDLTKAVSGADDERIEAAAAEGAEGDGSGTGGKDTETAAAGDGEEALGKALTAKDPETGEETDAIDATELLKSMVAEMGSIKDGTAKVMTAIVGQLKTQGDLLKTLHADMRQLGAGGRGRRSVLTVHEKVAPDLAKALGAEAGAEGGGQAEPEGMKPQEFLTKALAAANDGAITYHDANYCETVIGRGGQPPPEIVTAVAEHARKAAS
jgi:hypothetical protein